MLTQEDFVFPDMSGEGVLRRSSWKAEAIRRGDLKISGPFPITEDTPLSDDEEREYAEKHNIPSPVSDTAPLQPQQPPPPPPPPPQHQQPGESVHAEAPDEPTEPEEQKSPEEPKGPAINEAPLPSTLPQEAQDMSPVGKSSAEPTPSSPSPFPSLRDSNGKTTPKKKRKSGLRSVFRKMFGRRSRESAREGDDEEVVRKHEYHRSDPGVLSRTPEQQEEQARPRISDLPVRELEPINPLGRHLPFPMNINAPQDASPPHEYLTFEVPEQSGRRRATLPSIQLTENEVQALSAAWGGKPVRSLDERLERESIPSPQIGMAISSPSAALSIRSKRRSRSAGALREWAKAGRPSTERRRSAEIRHWRNSYQSGSVYSCHTPRPRTAQTVDTVQTAGEPAKSPESTIDSVAQTSGLGIAQHEQDISEIELPVEAFNFGNLRTQFSDDEGQVEEAERETAVAQPAREHSIEERVQYLEDNMRVLETSVRRISGRSNRQTIILENAPKGRRSRDRSTSATSNRQSSHHSSKSSNRTVSIMREPSNPPSPTMAPLSAVSESPASANRPQTMIALEPSAMPRPTSSQDSAMKEQFEQLYAALKHERTSRKLLEKQVYSLQRELAELHNLFNKFASSSPAYPTPSPDAVMISNEERLSTPRASGPHMRGLGFESDQDRMSGSTRNVRETIISRFSHSDSEGVDEAGDEGYSATSSRDDLASPETWATPKEEIGGFFPRNRSKDEVKGASDDEMF
ncbi:hypothetical protein EJ04DRAFT_238516 [Polyplosphaeria fusca]|uniref:Uncharacterized protein n=1 Tax=Polyplosphaeria fusca TaxID=682080 RepID=A0A9P4R712_9PLEO|nr:hypothetical protein EJ04DRAFT_238516 [Polyplosphaeria fusca]